MRPKRKALRWIGAGCVALAVLLAVAFSRPVRVEYHKWRLTAAKREHVRLGRGEYRFSDRVRESIGNPLTWNEVLAAWKGHEQSLVELGVLYRKEYYARRGKIPTRANPDFVRVIQQMEQICPWWGYAVSTSESSLTVTATQEGLELWKKLAPSLGLQEDKPTKEGRHRKKCGRRQRGSPTTPVRVEWSAAFGRSGGRSSR